MEALPNESTKVAFTVTNTGLVAGTSTEPVAGTCTQQKMGVRIGNEQQTTGVKVGAEPAGMEPVYETIMLELDRIKQVIMEKKYGAYLMIITG